MRAGTTQTDEAKKAIRRTKENKWNKNRDYRILAQLRRAEKALLPPHKLPADRFCLGCSKSFRSQWIGNRMCGDCKGMNL